MSANGLIGLGAILAGIGVAAGAFGAHGLQGLVPESRLEVFETAVRYHLIHAVALILVATISKLSKQDDETGLGRYAPTAYLMLAGVTLFSGSLYILVLADVGWLGAITPFGGAALIASWFMLAYRALRS